MEKQSLINRQWQEHRHIIAVRIRGIGARVVMGLQRIPVFRRQVKRFRPAYVIQEASQDDLRALYAWLRPNQDMPASERSSNPNLTNFVARRGGEVLGFVRLMRHPEADFPHTGHWLYSLTVRTRYRVMGIGTALTQRVIDQSRVEGAAELLLALFEDNVPAIALYRALGFERVVLSALEAKLAADVQKYGRRRLALRKVLG